MSVINRMLQDLENRRGNTGSDKGLAIQVRSVPKRKRAVGWTALLVTIVVVLVALLWLGWVRGAIQRLPAGVIMQTRPAIAILKTVPKVASATQPIPSTAIAVTPPPLAAPTMLAFALKPSLSLGLPVLEAPPAPKNTHPVIASSTRSTIVPKRLSPDLVPLAPTLPASPASPALETRDALVNPTAVKEITAKQRADNAYASALALIQENRSADAVDLLGSVLQQDPANSAARRTLAGLLVAARRYDEAQRLLQDGLKIDPAQSSQAMLLARLQVEQGNVGSGLATLQRSLPAGAERADYQGFLAALLQREGRNREAIEHYQIALRKSPGSGVWLTGLGISLQSENRLAEAHEAFERALASNSLKPELKAFVEQQLQR